MMRFCVLLDAVSSISSLPKEAVLPALWSMVVTLGKRLLVAAIFFFIASWVISWIRKIVKKILSRNKIDQAVASFMNSLVNVTLKIVMVVAIIGILGIETTSLAAILAAASLAIGLAMKDNLSNFAGGVMILLNKPFKLGDYIVAQSMEGTVTGIGILYTVMLTGDNKTIFMPNGKLSTGSIINFSTQDRRRVDFVLNIVAGTDIDSLKLLIMNVVLVADKVLQTPAPFVGITKLKENSYEVSVRVWALSENIGGVTTVLNEALYRALSEKGIYVPSVLTVKMS